MVDHSDPGSREWEERNQNTSPVLLGKGNDGEVSGGIQEEEDKVSQLFHADATVRHCWTIFKVEIQRYHYCIGDGSYIDVHKFIWALSWLQPNYQG